MPVEDRHSAVVAAAGETVALDSQLVVGLGRLVAVQSLFARGNLQEGH